jgi:hypothetical protein
MRFDFCGIPNEFFFALKFNIVKISINDIIFCIYYKYNNKINQAVHAASSVCQEKVKYSWINSKARKAIMANCGNSG